MNLKNLIIAIVGIVLVVLAVRWIGWHDKAVEAANDQYTQCVWAQYHTTPAAWYAEHSVYPTCN